MKGVLQTAFFILAGLIISFQVESAPAKFRVLALYEKGGHHVAFSKRARIWLDSLAQVHHFKVDYIQNTEQIDENYLANYDLIFQLDFVPYGWPPKAMAAFEKYVEKGRGGWIGLHHATLLGEFDGFKMWPWFSDFMGGIRYKNYISTFVAATVNVKDQTHPVMAGVPASFNVAKEEWYIYDKSPAGKVDVLANVDEDSYVPDSEVKMGDHPVIWSNPHFKARNVYIFMGHAPELFDNESYKRILANAILWASSKKQ